MLCAERKQGLGAVRISAKEPLGLSVAASATVTDGLPVPQRHWAFVAIALATVISVLDATIGNIALPTIARDLHVSAAASVWVIIAYQIAVIATLLPFASLGEIVGYRRVSLVGLCIFSLGAVAAASSHSLLTLSVSRIVQGLGASAVLSVSGALVRFTYPHAMLGRALGMNAMVIAISAAAGPTWAASILAFGDWRWLFGCEVPLSLAALFLGWCVLPPSESAPRRLNLGSALLNVSTFGFLITGAQAFVSGHDAWAAGPAVAAGLVAGALLVKRELTEHLPLLPLDLMRNRIFRLSVGTSICCFIAQSLAFVSLPFDFQVRLGYSVIQTGLLLTPWPLMIVAVAPFAGRFADRYSAGSMATLGMVIFGIGMALLALIPLAATRLDIAWRMLVCGLGFALFQAPNNRALLSAAPRSRSGAASGMLSMARSLGSTAGAVGAAACLKASVSHGSTIALGSASIIALVAAGFSSLRLIAVRTK
ncbi:MAG: MFS transporter [Pseudomonadota bacterium]|nr:MFS transporter [Pseudomonadota bacterium]